ncbi:DUF397 domain-containing protein [Saccharopolyspora rosea]|uniref:DUF397 domain-containing protein n=1 Tax=Saccharopolyspora rosea TaxID=524884 RepID=A0ABW3G1H3_9PSEU|nr:DUF397 domain-containing protein [Saccharopolyspora rosea]
MSAPVWRKSSYSANNGVCVEVAFSDPAWRKSSHSANNGECVEVALGERAVGARDSKDVEGGELWFSQRRWGNFVGAVKAGRFDLGS